METDTKTPNQLPVDQPVLTEAEKSKLSVNAAKMAYEEAKGASRGSNDALFDTCESSISDSSSLIKAEDELHNYSDYKTEAEDILDGGGMED